MGIKKLIIFSSFKDRCNFLKFLYLAYNSSFLSRYNFFSSIYWTKGLDEESCQNSIHYSIICDMGECLLQ